MKPPPYMCYTTTLWHQSAATIYVNFYIFLNPKKKKSEFFSQFAILVGNLPISLSLSANLYILTNSLWTPIFMIFCTYSPPINPRLPMFCTYSPPINPWLPMFCTYSPPINPWLPIFCTYSPPINYRLPMFCTYSPPINPWLTMFCKCRPPINPWHVHPPFVPWLPMFCTYSPPISPWLPMFCTCSPPFFPWLPIFCTCSSTFSHLIAYKQLTPLIWCFGLPPLSAFRALKAWDSHNYLHFHTLIGNYNY